MRRNILIFHQAALGDFIVTWPLTLGLARMFPQSRVTYVTASSKGKLAEKVLGVESADAEAGWHALHVNESDLPERNRKSLSDSHLIIAFGLPDAAWERNVREIAPGAAFIRLDTKPAPEHHVTAHLLNQLKDHPAIHEAMSQMLRSVAARGIAFRRSPQDRIVIHPGAGKPEKCWPADKYFELIQRIGQATSVRVVLGEVELERWGADAIHQIESIAEVRRPATYLELLDEIAQAGVFAGNDSGPAHLAGIVGVPSVVLFGSSPNRWKPLGPGVSVVHEDPINEIKVERVESEIRKCTKVPAGMATQSGARSH